MIPVVVVDPRPPFREAISHLLEGHPEFTIGTPATSAAELFRRSPKGSLCVAVVGAGAVDKAEEHAIREATRPDRPLRLLILAEEYNEEVIRRLLMLGCSGYLAGEVTAEILKKAILAVARGETWAERHLVTRTLQQALAAHGTDSELTSREWEILGLLRAGHSNRQIAELLFISPETVKWHVRKVFSKIGARDRLEAMLWARDHNIFPRLDHAPGVAPEGRAPRKP